MKNALLDGCVEGWILGVLVFAVVFVELDDAQEKSSCGPALVRTHHTFGLRGSSPPSDVAEQTDIKPFYCIWREGNSLLQLEP